MMLERTDTAHEAWDRTWRGEDDRKRWSIPEPEVEKRFDLLREYGVRRVLDLGCGIGRHAIVLARHGFEVFAVDASETGIEALAEEASREDLSIELRVGMMTDIPYAAGFFDYILAWNVVYHGDLAVVSRTISEVLRTLKRGGLFQGTLLSKRNPASLRGEEISYQTRIDRSESEKAHPHFFCDVADVGHLLYGFELLDLAEHDQSGSGSYHWNFLAVKR